MSTPGHYAGPVILASEHEGEKKTRVIDIIKAEVFKDIDLYTHKHVDAHEDMGKRSANAVSSDSMEDVDGAVIARYVEFRNAQLRHRIQLALAETVGEYATDELTVDNEKYVYSLRVPDEFNDNALRPLAEYMHRFLVFGALYDWYGQFGMGMADFYGRQLKEMENLISDTLRGPSIVKRPLQPFGPAYKIK